MSDSQVDEEGRAYDVKSILHAMRNLHSAVEQAALEGNALATQCLHDNPVELLRNLADSFRRRTQDPVAESQDLMDRSQDQITEGKALLRESRRRNDRQDARQVAAEATALQEEVEDRSMGSGRQ